MAIVNIASYTGRLYQYNDVAQNFIMNPDNDSGLNALTGWNNTILTIAQLSALHNGTTIFTGRDDYSGDAQKFPIMILASGGIITNSTQLKIRVDRDPTITQPLTTLSKEDMTDNGDGTFYIDVAYDVDKGYSYEQLAESERWYFPENGPFDVTYPQSISFTDVDTGRSHTENYDIEYIETSAITKPWADIATVGVVFDDGTADLVNYINPTDGQTLTSTQGPAYSGTTTLGNKETYQPHMSILFETIGDDLSWTGKHMIYPNSQHKTIARTSQLWNGSANNGYFNLQGDWSMEYDLVLSGPQDATEYSTCGAPVYSHIMQVSDGVDQPVGTSILSLYNYEYEFDVNNGPNIIIDGVYLTNPIPSNTINIRNYKVAVCYHYNATLSQGEATAYYLHKYNGSIVSAMTVIPAPSARTATQDVVFNGGFTNGEFQEAGHKTMGGFVYYDGICIDPEAVDKQWMRNNLYYFDSCLNIGDSWTKTFGLDANTQGYTNRLMSRMDTDSLLRYKSYHIKYTPDYYFTPPAGTPVPAWGADLGVAPISGDINDLTSLLDDRIIPNKVNLNYTGINFALQYFTTKEQSTPIYGDKYYGLVAYYCQAHVDALDARGIPWTTWDSCPSGYVLDGGQWPNPAPQNDLIDRHEDPTYTWASFFPGKTISVFQLVNDPANNGRILPARTIDNNVHIDEVGYQIYGDYLYDNHPEVLP